MGRQTERNFRLSNERGMALIIVLLVTALLIALVFEFAYATRVSLRAAINYRDSERAYYLARSGVNFAGRYLASNLQTDSTGTDHKYDRMEQKDWQTVPFLPGVDTELQVRWDDEAGKIKIIDAQSNRIRLAVLRRLFENKEVESLVLDRLTESTSDVRNLRALSGLYTYMNDEDYFTVSPFLTVNPNVDKININTASEDVLLAMGLSSGAVSLIIDDRGKGPIKELAGYAPLGGVQIENSSITNFLTTTSDDFKVYSYATVGGYKKKVEAIIRRSSNGSFTVSYWSAL